MVLLPLLQMVYHATAGLVRTLKVQGLTLRVTVAPLTLILTVLPLLT
jgi:hypothetical protein